MKERPILFSAPMVRAILDDRKTQTRRIVKPQPAGDELVINKDGSIDGYKDAGTRAYNPACYWRPMQPPMRCLYGQPGDRLWVRETFRRVFNTPPIYEYRADNHEPSPLSPKWKPSIFCTRAASRITLEIVAVRVERLQAITADDARSEGHPRRAGMTVEVDDDAARDWYMDLWNEINGAGSWEANPWIWVITFKRITP